MVFVPQGQSTTAASPTPPFTRSRSSLAKAPTGISGLDEITNGGLPAGRSTLVCGGAGCGKTVLAMEFLVQGVLEFDEPGLFITFDETRKDLHENCASFGVDLDALERSGKFMILEFPVGHEELIEGGDFSLDGLFIQIEHAVARIGARRVALDTIETLFGSISRNAILRAELARLIRWLKERGLTSIITGERGDNSLTRHGVEAYVSDCVVLLDHRTDDLTTKRRLRIIKYRGSGHGNEEHPFLIGQNGVSVIPLSSARLDYEVTAERVGTGVPTLDEMLAGDGYHRGSSVLASGTVGTGKSSLAAAFAVSTCRRGERCLYLAFEESPAQVLRNMRSIGIDLAHWQEQGLLLLTAMRPTMTGLEEHLASIFALTEQYDVQSVVIDPVTDFLTIGNGGEVRSMLTRLFDYLKNRQITAFATSLLRTKTATTISSLMDTWIALDTDASDRGHRRLLRVVKARGIAHARDTRELVLSSEGISIRDLPAAATARGPGNAQGSP